MSTCSSTDSGSSVSGTRFLQFLTCLIVAITVIASSGCSTLRLLDEQAALTYRDFVWAKRAYNLRYGRCDRPYSEHFRNGFCEGYADICNGGDGYVPALPPDSYRSYEFQSADGSKCVNAWFEGYPAGVKAAKQDKSGTYHDIMISRMIDQAVKQDNSKATLPGQVSVVDGKTQRSEAAITVPPSNQPRSISPINPVPSVVTPINESPPTPFSLSPASGFNVSGDYSQPLPPISRGWNN